MTETKAGTDALVTAQRRAGPSVSADYVGQVFIDTIAKVGYMAVGIGAGTADWKQITNHRDARGGHASLHPVYRGNIAV